MALMRGKLFAGALFAGGLLFGPPKQSAQPDAPPVRRLVRPLPRKPVENDEALLLAVLL